MRLSQIMSVGTAVPPYALHQQEIENFVEDLFHDKLENLSRLLPVFENGLVRTRHFCRPLTWYQDTHSFADANRIYEESALDLAEEAALSAMRQAAVHPEQIGMVIYVSSTGIATPSLDAKIIQRLNLSPHTPRIPIWGLGCAGGVTGLARASELAQNLKGKAVLLIAVELCSLTFQQSDYSKANLIATSLFADGAAAALIAVDGGGPAVLGSHSTLFPNSEDIMGWELVDSGLKVRFSRSIPSIICNHLPKLRGMACDSWGISTRDLSHYIVHPGGAKVIDAYIDSLGLSADTMKHAYQVLEGYGNMSSVSILFVLEKFLAETPPSSQYGTMLALGPGFSAEQVLFKW